MMASKLAFDIRRVDRRDSHVLCSILNEIVAIGGTTAIENSLSDSEFQSYFLNESSNICCFLAENNGKIVGFQSSSVHPDLPDRWADIATFARVKPKSKGVGSSLFEATLNYLRNQNVDVINATIRADNIAGLGYYSKMGFTDYSVAEKVPLQDGTPVDRISKKYVITNA